MSYNLEDFNFPSFFKLAQQAKKENIPFKGEELKVSHGSFYVEQNQELKSFLCQISPSSSLRIHYFSDGEREYLALGSCYSFHLSRSDSLELSFSDSSSSPSWKTLLHSSELIYLCASIAFAPPPSQDISIFKEEGKETDFSSFFPALNLAQLLFIRDINPQEKELQKNPLQEIKFFTYGNQDFFEEIQESFSFKRPQNSSEDSLEKNTYSMALKPTPSQWDHFISQALFALQNKENPLTKIVCARSVELLFDKPPLPSTLFSHLSSQNKYLFFLKFREKTFMGNTPEKLLAFKEGQFTFDALAGTKLRGENEKEDREWEEKLIRSPKEQFEHRQVVDSIRGELHKWGKIEEKKQYVLKLKSLQHLKTPLLLTPHRKISPLELLPLLISRLHPTPAVGGRPREEALTFLHHHEPFSRGLYAGALGIIHKEQSQLCVGIRSLLLEREKKKLTLYGGAGIVHSSKAQKEWEETGLKIKSFSPFNLENILDYDLSSSSL